jgi:glycosyltransferase involved in cell wall biosynthesis
MIIVTWYHIAITTVLVALAFVTAWNLRHFRRLAAPLSSIQADVLVSVLVPARNEERCIELCIRSLCAQTYSSMEVIVLDDGSTDSTPEILDALLAEFPSRLSVIRGAPLPEGWVGKPWACHQLALAAKGNVLLFTDADTMHQPTVVNAAVTTLMNDDIDFFSLVPYQEMRTWAEHAVIPMVHVLYTSYLPNNLILSHPSISLSAANGQFMCFKREAYEGIGGHSAVRNNIVEDIALAKALKRRGFRIALLDGHIVPDVHVDKRGYRRVLKEFLPCHEFQRSAHGRICPASTCGMGISMVVAPGRSRHSRICWNRSGCFDSNLNGSFSYRADTHCYAHPPRDSRAFCHAAVARIPYAAQCNNGSGYRC